MHGHERDAYASHGAKVGRPNPRGIDDAVGLDASGCRVHVLDALDAKVILLDADSRDTAFLDRLRSLVASVTRQCRASA